MYTSWLSFKANQQVFFFFSLSRSEYHNQATWESGVASMMQNSKLLLFLFLNAYFVFWLFDDSSKF